MCWGKTILLCLFIVSIHRPNSTADINKDGNGDSAPGTPVSPQRSPRPQTVGRAGGERMLGSPSL
jgi:hypothetical protein